jgi:hypothetical protein
MAVGVFGTVAQLRRAGRADARIHLALRANEEGYALLETFEVNGNPVKDEVTYLAVEALSRRVDAAALLISGLVDEARLETIAADVRMVIVRE